MSLHEKNYWDLTFGSAKKRKSQMNYKAYCCFNNMSENNVWKESGAIVYVAITIIVFVFFVLIGVWIMTRRKIKRYSPVNNDLVELVKNVEEKEFSIEDSGSEEDIDLYSDNFKDDGGPSEDDGPLEAV